MTVFPDVEGGVRDYLRGVAAVTATLAKPTAVWFGVPEDADEADYPCVTVSLVGGGEVTGATVPILTPVIQCDVWGPVGAKRATYAAAAAVAEAMSSIGAAGVPTTLTAGVVGCGAEVESILWEPDPADGRPRYVITATVTVRAG